MYLKVQVFHLLNMEDQLVENMEIDKDTCNYSSEEDDEVNELIREIFGDEESLEEEHEEEYEDGNEMWNETRENYEDEYSLLRERRFVVGEGALVSLIKRTTCEQCGELIDPSTVVEVEKIPEGVNYEFLCCSSNFSWFGGSLTEDYNIYSLPLLLLYGKSFLMLAET